MNPIDKFTHPDDLHLPFYERRYNINIFLVPVLVALGLCTLMFVSAMVFGVIHV